MRISAGQRRRELVVLAKTILLSGRGGSRAARCVTSGASCSEPGCPRRGRARLGASRRSMTRPMEDHRDRDKLSNYVTSETGTYYLSERAREAEAQMSKDVKSS